ncbi:MAG: HAD family phosphatase, partial [Ignavibacteriota bacterium]
HSYAKAINQLSSNTITEEEVIESFKSNVGLARNEVARNFVQEFKSRLDPNAKSDDETLENLVLESRLEIYNNMLSDPEILPRYCCKMTMGFLTAVKDDNYLTGLATMSHCMQVERVLQIMNIKDHFKFVITRDEIDNAKPHPEIYLRMKNKFNVEPDECIVIEDSVAGIKAAVSANMSVFAVTNSITRESVNKAKLIDKKFIIENPAELKTKVYDFIKAKN